MPDITKEVSSWLDRMLGVIEGRSGGGGTQTTPKTGAAPGAGAPPPCESVPPYRAESALAAEIRAALAAGGINIAIYMIGDPTAGNDKEFKRQAGTWAGNHGAFGLSGSTVKKNHAMPLSEDPGKLVSDLLAAMKSELRPTETIAIANVALFSHGGQRSMQIDSQGAGGGEKWATSSNKVVTDFTAAVKPALTAGAKIHLFACTAAKDRDSTKDKDDATRVDSFAEDMQELTGAEVWGHENAAHTTGNARLVQITDTDADANAERYQIRDVLARKFLVHVDSTLTEPQMGYLEKKLGISGWIKSSLKSGLDETKKLSAAESKQLDRHQIFIEEISMLGYDRLFDLLIVSSAPDATVFRGLFPEHDQIDKLVAGFARVHGVFHQGVEQKKKAITAARAKPDFPSAAP